MASRSQSLFDRKIIVQAAVDSFRKLNPRSLARNPVIFVTEVGAALTTAGLFLRSKEEPLGFVLQVTLWLWFTVLFANFAEAMAEGRGKAQADSLRKARRDVSARRLGRAPGNGDFDPKTARCTTVASALLRKDGGPREAARLSYAAQARC